MGYTPGRQATDETYLSPRVKIWAGATDPASLERERGWGARGSTGTRRGPRGGDRGEGPGKERLRECHVGAPYQSALPCRAWSQTAPASQPSQQGCIAQAARPPRASPWPPPGPPLARQPVPAVPPAKGAAVAVRCLLKLPASEVTENAPAHADQSRSQAKLEANVAASTTLPGWAPTPEPQRQTFEGKGQGRSPKPCRGGQDGEGCRALAGWGPGGGPLSSPGQAGCVPTTAGTGRQPGTEGSVDRSSVPCV